MCSAPDVRDINARLTMGVPVAKIAAETSYSESAIRRHGAAHLGRLADLGPDAEHPVTDLIERLSLVLDDLDRVRRSALSTARGDLVVKSASAAARVIDSLSARLGIDDLETAKLLREGDNLATAVARAVRRDPAVGRSIAGQLAPLDTELADAIAALAARAETQTAISQNERNDR